jgi:glycosyltransferase involved in cell wall biosynthesis
MTIGSTYRFLFVSLLILGKDTAYRNLRRAVSRMEDVDSTWLPIEMDPRDPVARIPIVSGNHSLKYGLVARARVRALEKGGKKFDAAYFNHVLPTLFLGEFRRRVPCYDAMDVTPASLRRDGQSYYETPRRRGLLDVTELKRKYAISVYRRARCLLPQSDYGRTSLLRDYELPDDKIRIFVPGVDLEVWRGRDPVKDIGSTDGPLNILFVGGDFRRKGGDVLLRLAARKEFRTAEFHFVTRSSTGATTPNVHIHANVSANSDALVNLYQRADVFVLPTRADFAPTNSICEAMAMGLPVVTTGVGGLDENVIDGETGYIVPVGDEEALAQRLMILQSDRDLRLRMGSNARKWAEAKFDSARNARMLIDLMKLGAG